MRIEVPFGGMHRVGNINDRQCIMYHLLLILPILSIIILLIFGLRLRNLFRGGLDFDEYSWWITTITTGWRQGGWSCWFHTGWCRSYWWSRSMLSWSTRQVTGTHAAHCWQSHWMQCLMLLLWSDWGWWLDGYPHRSRESHWGITQRRVHHRERR